MLLLLVLLCGVFCDIEYSAPLIAYFETEDDCNSAAPSKVKKIIDQRSYGECFTYYGMSDGQTFTCAAGGGIDASYWTGDPTCTGTPSSGPSPYGSGDTDGACFWDEGSAMYKAAYCENADFVTALDPTNHQSPWKSWIRYSTHPYETTENRCIGGSYPGGKKVIVEPLGETCFSVSYNDGYGGLALFGEKPVSCTIGSDGAYFSNYSTTNCNADSIIDFYSTKVWGKNWCKGQYNLERCVLYLDGAGSMFVSVFLFVAALLLMVEM